MSFELLRAGERRWVPVLVSIHRRVFGEEAVGGEGDEEASKEVCASTSITAQLKTNNPTYLQGRI